jgi:DNA (cytosine-5)-methyltransferase 1
MFSDELVVDAFAGGGGVSVGIETALGRSPDVAVNHDPEAVAMHQANHPKTRHLCGSMWDYNPRAVCGGRPVALCWFSPDCTFHSKARGAKPFRERNPARRRRGLAWVAVRWAEAVRPRVIILENVEEFADWGPLDEDGRPDPARRGFTFRRWLTRLQNLGYEAEVRELRACDYGAPTTRKRLFVIARCDGRAIVWPEPTHHRGTYRAAAECIDWTLPVPSIFARRKPLAVNTLRRIARGVRRYVLEAAEPFVIRTDMHLSNAACVYDAGDPLGTVVGGGIKHALVSAFLAKHYGGHETPGTSLRLPFDTITCTDHHAVVVASLASDRRDDVRAFLLAYYGTEQRAQLQMPLPTVTTHARFAIVTVAGRDYEIADIGMRMMVPRELFRAQGFPDTYVIDPAVDGKPLSKTAQVRMCGNSVPPPVAAALVAANVTVERARRVA